MLGPLPRGVAREALAIGECARAKDVAWMAGQVRYGRDGRPTDVSLASVPLAAPCLEALRALYLAALPPADGWTPLPAGDAVMTRLDAAHLLCVVDAPAPAARVGGRRGRSRIQEPKKLHNVDPIYPEAAKSRRIQGVVVLDATIGASGCVQAVQVVRNVHPSLDAQALAAVSQWRYTPTLLDGVAVPVIMTITVNFRLN
jgi:protein TonB